MLTSELRDVLRRFVAAPSDRRRRRRLPAVVVGAPEVLLPLPGPRPTVLRPTPNTLSVEELTVTRLRSSVFRFTAGGYGNFEFFGRKFGTV